MRSSLFEILPADVVRYMSRYLHLHGPSVQLIEGGPSDEEKKIVMAVALDGRGKPDPNRPHLNTYHLIARYSNEKREIEYSIGFCKKLHNVFNSSLEYRTQPLDEKSPLLRYVTEDLTHRQYSKLFPYDSEKKGNYTRSQDRVLLKYMELEIKAAGGLTCHPCTLSYRDPKSKAYARREIPKEDPLFAIAGELFQRLHQANGGQGNRHAHCFTRHNRDLALVKGVLQKLGRAAGLVVVVGLFS